jgi:hypothetical protein
VVSTTETPQEAAGFVCLYFGPTDECWNCCGWTKAAGGPFEGDPRFCSEDCYADAAERARKQELRLACCPQCGYDRQEHAPDCSANVEPTPRRSTR